MPQWRNISVSGGIRVAASEIEWSVHPALSASDEAQLRRERGRRFPHAPLLRVSLCDSAHPDRDGNGVGRRAYAAGVQPGYPPDSVGKLFPLSRPGRLKARSEIAAGPT